MLYAASTHGGSRSYSSYVHAPISGPLSTSQTPGQIPYSNYGWLPGQRPTPPQFYPSQTPVDAQDNTHMRSVYKRVFSNPLTAKQFPAPTVYHVASSQRQVPTSTHTNYIPPVPSSLYLLQRKAVAVGQSAYAVGLPTDALKGTKSWYPSGTRSSIRRVRSGGCVAPAKKGSIYNTSLTNGAVCAWGSIVRSTY